MQSKTLVDLRLALIFVVALLIGACSGSPEDKIVGTWYEIGDNETMEFFADGTITIAEGRESMAGNYSFLDESKLRIELGGLGALAGPLVVSYEFEGDILKLTYNGDVSKYSRSKDGKKESAAATSSSSASKTQIAEQVMEGLNLSGGAKAAVTEYYMDQKKFPATNIEAGVAAPDAIRGRFVSSVAIRDGVITVTYGGDAAPSIAGKTLMLSPRGNRGSVEWSCSSRSIERKYLPTACQ